MVSRALQGVFRSLRIYQGPDVPRAKMDALYRQFIKPGDLVFDIGAHVGDRVSSFRRIGARAVAVEPQPLLVRALRLIHGRDPAVLIVPAAVASSSSEQTLFINSANPTVSTLSGVFLVEADGAAGWEGQIWDRRIKVPAVTLDWLISKVGVPAFIKIDVEGFEDEALAGLSQPIAALSFEFTTIARDVAQRGLERLAGLGGYVFNVALGETQSLSFPRFISAAEMSAHIAALPHSANSGDIYARLESASTADF